MSGQAPGRLPVACQRWLREHPDRYDSSAEKLYPLLAAATGYAGAQRHVAAFLWKLKHLAMESGAWPETEQCDIDDVRRDLAAEAYEATFF